jgi:hypothetical protein
MWEDAVQEDEKLSMGLPHTYLMVGVNSVVLSRVAQVSVAKPS